MIINWFKSKFGKKSSQQIWIIALATSLNSTTLLKKTPEPMPSLFPSVAKSSKLDFEKIAKSSFDKSRRWLYDMSEIWIPQRYNITLSQTQMLALSRGWNLNSTKVQNHPLTNPDTWSSGGFNLNSTKSSSDKFRCWLYQLVDQITFWQIC